MFPNVSGPLFRAIPSRGRVAQHVRAFLNWRRLPAGSRRLRGRLLGLAPFENKKASSIVLGAG